MASKKLRGAKTAKEDELQVDMSPMIDMVFLLLIFFIVASTVVVVKQDAEVEPSIADNSKKAKDGQGRIVINVREDGSFRAEDFNLVFDDDKTMEEYIKEKKNIEDAKGFKPIIHLRGDKQASFKYVRTVIRAASNAGVDNVVFSVYGFE